MRKLARALGFLLVAGLPAFGAAAAPRRCDVLIQGAVVVTSDAAGHVYSSGAVAVEGNRIVAVGPEAEVAGRFESPRRIRAQGKILMPGLVNAHGHAAMTIFRGLGPDRALQDWLTNVIFPAEARNVSPELVHDGTLLACLEMLEGGTTTFADMYYFESDAARAVHEAGMRAVLGETFIDAPAPDHKDLAETLRSAEEFIKKWKPDPLIVPSVAPHAPYTCSWTTLEAARRLALKYGVPLQIHVAETRKESDDALAKWGRTPVRYLKEIGFFAALPYCPDLIIRPDADANMVLGVDCSQTRETRQPVATVIAHGVHVPAEDRAILKELGIAVAHNPESNMKLSSGAAPVAEYEKEGIVWSLGTDGAASNDDLSMFEAMDYAAKLAKLSTGDPSALPARAVVRAATIGGARALGLDKKTGSLEEGKEADMILVDASSAHAVPGEDVYATIVYSLKSSDVTDVWVAGRQLVKDRRPTALDEASIKARAIGWRKKIKP